MSRDTYKTPASDGGKLTPTLQELPLAKTFPIPEGPAERMLSTSVPDEQCPRESQVSRCGEPADETSILGLLRCAVADGDRESRARVAQYLSNIVRPWLDGHPGWETVCRGKSEDYFVEQALEQFWQVTTAPECMTLTEVFVCLRICLNGAILEAVRADARSRLVSGEFSMENVQNPQEIWKFLQRISPSAREQRLVYLLYHCGLKPGEIVRMYPQEWSNVQEIARLRRDILVRFMSEANQLQ